MAKYNIIVTASAEKAIKKLPRDAAFRIVTAIQSLATDPYPAGCRKLSGYEYIYRIRVQTYRIIYEIHQKIIEIKILKVGHRKDVYR